MKAAIAPAVNRRWEVKEIQTPEPGEGQVLTRIAASGLCYTDVHQTRGEVPGLSAAGLLSPSGGRFRARPHKTSCNWILECFLGSNDPGKVQAYSIVRFVC